MERLPSPRVGVFLPKQLAMRTMNRTPIPQIFKMSLFNLSLLTLMLALSCSSGDSPSDAGPTDFQIQVAQVGADAANPHGDGSGKVILTASANNAVRYAFRIGTGDLIDSQTGILEHQFLDNGTHVYNIAAWA